MGLDAVTSHIEKIRVPSIKKDLILIHQKLEEIKSAKEISGVSFENKINRLKSENPANYERFQSFIIPLISETYNNINEIEELSKKSRFKIPYKIKNFLNKSKMELEIDSEVLKNKFIK